MAGRERWASGSSADRLTADAAPCILCGGPPSGPAFPFASLWEGTVYRRLGCARCGCTYVTPLPKLDVLDRLYRPAAYHERFYAGPGDPDSADSLALIARRFDRSVTLLDVGCGNGDFLRAAIGSGYRAEGIEQNRQAIAFAARRSDAPVWSLDQLAASGRRFDLIRLASVQGHLPDPGQTFRRLEALLAPGGHFLVCGPLEKQPSLVYWTATSAKRARRMLGRERITAAPPHHLSSVSWASQRFFLQSVLGYRLSDIALEDTGWPYLPGDAADRSIGATVRRSVGAAAVRLSRTRIGRRLGLANSFRLFATPSDPRVQRPPVDEPTHRDHPG